MFGEVNTNKRVRAVASPSSVGRLPLSFPLDPPDNFLQQMVEETEAVSEKGKIREEE